MLKKPYDRLGKNYTSYFSSQHKMSATKPQKSKKQVTSQSRNNFTSRDNSVNSKVNKSKKSLLGNMTESKEALIQASQANMVRNLSPVIDRKLLLDLRASSSFKAPEKSSKPKVNKKRVMKSPNQDIKGSDKK